MITSDLLTELRTVLQDGQIQEKNEQIDSLGNGGKITVYPQKEEEISSVLQWANVHGKKVNIVGMGTKRGFGGLVEEADLLLSLEKYVGIVEHTAGDMTMTVKAGTRFKDLQQYLSKHGQMIALDPAHAEYATIGGVIAANDSGPKRLGYGSARDIVIGMRVVYPDGKVIRAGGKVVKNVAGYDMNKLFVGSMGTLGVISELTIRLRPIPKYESVSLLSFPDGDIENIRDFTIRLMDSMMEPVALELLSPSLSKKLDLDAVYTLAVHFEDVESSVKYQEEFIKRHVPDRSKLSILSEQKARSFWKKLSKNTPNGMIYEEGPQLEAHLKIGVKNLDVLQVMKESELQATAKNVHIQSHGGLGHGLCHVIIKGANENVMAALQDISASVNKIGGYTVAKHLPLSFRKTINVWGEKPTYFFLFEGMKQKVDPNRMLNEKRFIGGL